MNQRCQCLQVVLNILTATRMQLDTLVPPDEDIHGLGESVSRIEFAEREIAAWINKHLAD